MRPGDPAVHESKNVSKYDMNSLASDVVRLSRLLTSERDALPAAYLKDERLRNAYLAYFLPSNLSKIHKPLQELSLHPRHLLEKETLRILDIGAGPGTASIGILDFFSQQERRPRLDFLAVDQVAGNLKAAEELFISTPHRKALDASLKTVQADIGGMVHLLHGHFDMIVLSNILNELFAHDEAGNEKRAAIVSSILRRFLADDGSCIIIEPALRQTSRDMLVVRNTLVTQGLHVYSPCVHAGKCPALENPRDWCHEDIPWEATPLVREIDRLTGLHKDSLKFSYLVLRKDSFSLSDVRGADTYRVVSEPLVSKGKVEFYICGAGGRKLIIRLDRDATSLNKDYEKLRRGSLVTFERLVDEKKRYKVEKDTTLSVLAL
jgi:ribosomal protein RSM22 (predicted rRNA methylase)